MKSSSIQSEMSAQLADKTLFEQAKGYAYTYVDAAPHQRVFPDDQAIDNLAAFDEPLPPHPQSGAETLRMLHEIGSPATVAQIGGRYFGFVNGNAVPIAVAARWLSDVWDQNTALHVMSPIAAKLEQVCERWVRELLGLPGETVMGLVGGTSIATMCGLAAGRYALLKRLDWDVNADGLFGAPPIRVVVSEQAHGTVFKALALLGLGNQRIERVPADDQGRIDPTQLPALDARTLLILQAGNVNTGAFDDFEQICTRAEDAGAWVHIDGAFGLWAAASPNYAHLTAGMEKAHSWSVDGHKTLNTPYDCGIILCRDRDALVASMQATGAYIAYGEQRDSMLYTPDMSRRARAVELWATLRYLGKTGVAELIDGLCARATQFATELTAHDFTILNDVVFNQVLVACDTSAATQATLANIQASGECWCGGSTWDGAPVIRISVCSWATTADDIDRSVQAFVHARDAAAQTDFYPAKAAPPAELRTDRFWLRPLRATDVEFDYEAVMESADQLHRWSQTNWPTADFTLAENLADLERHEREHIAREAFTYTVFNPEGTRCLGCVYITPLSAGAAHLCGDAAYPADVGFWVRTSELENDLDWHLLATLRTWFADEWAFACILFNISQQEARQAALLHAAGLEKRAAFDLSDGRLCWAFG